MSLTLLSLALLAGCGGGDDKGDKAATRATTATTAPATTPKAANHAKPPKAKTTLKAAADELSKALGGGDCKALFKRATLSSDRGPDVKPGEPPTRAECKTTKLLVGQTLKGFERTKVEEFGPVGIVEGKGDRAKKGKVVATTWAVDRDGEWKLAAAGFFDPQIGKKPPAGSNFDQTAQRFVDATRRGDCNTFFGLFNPASRVVLASKNDKAAVCNAVARAYTRKDSALHGLADDPAAKPEKLGETLDMAWYGVKMKSGGYWSLLLWTKLKGLPPALAKGHPGAVGVMNYVTHTGPKD
jgi:hypothetical protein